MTAATARAAKRDQVGRLLARGIPDLQGRVYEARVWPLKQTELPAALVYGWHETKTRKTLDAWSHQFEVACGMAVEIRVQAPDGPSLEYMMEALAGQVEGVILTAPELLGPFGTLERIDRVETKMEAHLTAETPQGSVTLSFDFIWTEVHSLIVPPIPADATPTFGIASTPTTF